jgi:hypothetical protein
LKYFRWMKFVRAIYVITNEIIFALLCK